jgi:hypothetical protein
LNCPKAEDWKGRVFLDMDLDVIGFGAALFPEFGQMMKTQTHKWGQERQRQRQ